MSSGNMGLPLSPWCAPFLSIASPYLLAKEMWINLAMHASLREGHSSSVQGDGDGDLCNDRSPVVMYQQIEKERSTQDKADHVFFCCYKPSIMQYVLNLRRVRKALPCQAHLPSLVMIHPMYIRIFYRA